jgi:hypothetical protein
MNAIDEDITTPKCYDEIRRIIEKQLKDIAATKNAEIGNNEEIEAGEDTFLL